MNTDELARWAHVGIKNCLVLQEKEGRMSYKQGLATAVKEMAAQGFPV